MIDYVMKISEEGHSYNEGDAHLIYSSQYPTLKILENGSWSVNDTDGTGGTTEIYHNLGYRPMHFVWGQWWDSQALEVTSYYSQYPFSYYAGLQIYDNFKSTIDTTKLTINLNINSTGAPSSQTYIGFYIIFYEPSV